MSRVDRIQENKARTLAKVSGDVDGQDPLDSSDTSDSGDIRVISSIGDTLSDVTSNIGDFASDTFSSVKDFASGIFSDKSKEERKEEFQDQASTATVSGNSATVDPTKKFSGPALSNPVAEQSVTDVVGNSRNRSSSSEASSSGTNSVVKNPLNDFASYNCIFTLGVLSLNDSNNPLTSYRKSGATYTILRSGGGGIDASRVTTGFEKNGNLEYFIDDVEVESIMAPNQQTGISLGTRISFKVYEPYSLGLFLQSLEIAALKANHKNYVQAPYLLEVDFIGWDSNGVSKPAQYCSRKIPFKLINIEFNVENGGSVYEVEAIPWNEQTLADDVQKITDPVEIVGATAAEVLSFGQQSLTQVLNQKQRETAENDNLPLSDLYAIRFPKSRVRGGAVNSSSSEGRSATVSKESASGSSVISTAQYESRIGSFFSKASSENNSNIFQGLVSASTTDVNDIGSSTMVENYNQGGNHAFPRGLFTYDKETQVYKRNGIELSLSDNERTFKFPQGMTVQKIIEEIVLISSYGENANAKPDKDGMLTWFKVETECYLLDSPEVEEALGRKPRVYVYNVVPYRVHASINSPPNKGGKGAENLAKQVSKKYNYIYSGANKDVLSFDIQFRTAFFEAVKSDRSNSSDGDRKGDSGSRTQQDETTQKGMDDTPGDIDSRYPYRSVIAEGEYTGGGSESNAKISLAKHFHNTLLNSKADLITADLEIWGDPYFLPDSGMGNYSAPKSGAKDTITADGSMDYQRNEVYILVNFKTPVDYKAMGGMSFQSETTTIQGFSGFYRVIRVDTTISGNKFTQKLELVRQRNQTLNGIGGNAVVDKQNAPSDK